jgi:hypothetical protein
MQRSVFPAFVVFSGSFDNGVAMAIWRWNYGRNAAGPAKYGRDTVAFAPEVL